MSYSDIIYKKRMSGTLSRAEIEEFIGGVAEGKVPDYQISAFLMAVCCRGMNHAETVDLTRAMAHCGDMLDLSEIEGVKVDKHSSGGVGDTTSLILVPLLACCGVKVAKMSGRGLGFTGGTIDKLESVPGFNTELPPELFIKTVQKVGCAISGQSPRLAPADKIMYALRDVTGTVDCVPLMVSSILSKKIAAGCDAVILDVKTGSGAIISDTAGSVALARELVEIGNALGKKFAALVTDMDQPLGNKIGNALELEEAIEVLSGEAEGDLKTVSLLLGAHLLVMAGKAKTLESATQTLEEAISSGAGLRKLAEMVSAQGGDERCIYNPKLLPQADKIIPVVAEKAGYLGSVVACELGRAAMLLGAGREKKSDKINPAVGIVMQVRRGDRVEPGQTLAVMHVCTASKASEAEALIRAAMKIEAEPPAPKPLIIDTVS